MWKIFKMSIKRVKTLCMVKISHRDMSQYYGLDKKTWNLYGAWAEEIVFVFASSQRCSFLGK